MADNPFFNASMMALGGQMAQAWQKFLETWWQGLLGDRERLSDLARVLSEAGLGGGGEGGAEDLSRVVKALELLEQRQQALEEQVQSLADNLSAVVTYLERAGGDPGDSDGVDASSPDSPEEEPVHG